MCHDCEGIDLGRSLFVSFSVKIASVSKTPLLSSALNPSAAQDYPLTAVVLALSVRSPETLWSWFLPRKLAGGIKNNEKLRKIVLDLVPFVIRFWCLKMVRCSMSQSQLFDVKLRSPGLMDRLWYIWCLGVFLLVRSNWFQFEAQAFLPLLEPTGLCTLVLRKGNSHTTSEALRQQIAAPLGFRPVGAVRVDFRSMKNCRSPKNGWKNHPPPFEFQENDEESQKLRSFFGAQELFCHKMSHLFVSFCTVLIQVMMWCCWPCHNGHGPHGNWHPGALKIWQAVSICDVFLLGAWDWITWCQILWNLCYSAWKEWRDENEHQNSSFGQECSGQRCYIFISGQATALWNPIHAKKLRLYFKLVTVWQVDEVSTPSVPQLLLIGDFNPAMKSVKPRW